jgi:cytochrome c oxidase assembly factor 6
MPFPRQEERKKCWTSKDVYWQCLTDNSDDGSKCGKERQEYENSCIKQWVIYFDRRRDYLKYKEKIETAGPEPLPDKKQAS